MSNYDLIIFDVDGCLTPGMDGIRFPDHVVRKLHTLRPKRFALAHNAGGVGLRYAVERAGGFGDTEEEKQASLLQAQSTYPTYEQVLLRLSTIAGQVSIITMRTCYIYACFAYQSKKGNWLPTPYDPKELAAWAYNDKEPQSMFHDRDPMWSKAWRKPAPGMLIAAMDETRTSPERTLFVGDTDTDKQAAEAAGCGFMRAKDFFGKDTL